MKANRFNLFPLLLAVPASHSMAISNGISFDLGASTDYSDNARKSEHDQIGEWQNQYNLGVNAHYANDWVLLNSNYDASRRTYSEDSQPSYNMLDGKTDINLGGQFDPATLYLSHTRRSLLNTPDAIDLTRNRDQRDILTANPAFKWRMTGADSLILSGNFSDINYRVDEAKNSSRSGGQLTWMREISKIDQVQISVQQNQTTFDSVPAADYKYQSVSASYSTQLSHLGYSIQVGQNRALRDSAENDYSSPYYNFEANYSTGINVFKFIASQVITDSSMGNGNRESIGGSGIGSVNVGIDLIKMRTFEVSWSSTALCERCVVNLNATKNTEDYQALPEDSNETSIGGGISYKLTRSSSLHVDIGRHKRSFADLSAHSDYTSDRGKISFDYQFVNDLSLKIYTQMEKRDSTGSIQNYDEHVTGLGLSYRF